MLTPAVSAEGVTASGTPVWPQNELGRFVSAAARSSVLQAAPARRVLACPACGTGRSEDNQGCSGRTNLRAPSQRPPCGSCHHTLSCWPCGSPASHPCCPGRRARRRGCSPRHREPRAVRGGERLGLVPPLHPARDTELSAALPSSCASASSPVAGNVEGQGSTLCVGSQAGRSGVGVTLLLRSCSAAGAATPAIRATTPAAKRDGAGPCRPGEAPLS